ncbi:GNAT family N-acetyltransferase [Streptomyces sp. V4-01]|uniref:GNAT family N-acetyltransferase n=1 Tax=Actinacidiphila polyblastidii TaxID=3110430 RepID=A0ABU7P5U9_9ACTN|nr:GNAT family N-acetyltransferase [Streptomyces sp. V4-01]
MSDDLRIETPEDEAALRDWRHVHNAVIPTAPLSLDEVRERVRRNHLEVVYRGGALVGCTTLRPPPPDDPAATATVIARVLPAHRGRGVGAALCARGVAQARARGARTIETVVLASNADGLRFAEARGFVEFERYVLPGDTIPFVTLRLRD